MWAEQREETRSHFTAASPYMLAPSSPAGATGSWQPSPPEAPLFGARRSVVPHSQTLSGVSPVMLGAHLQNAPVWQQML